MTHHTAIFTIYLTTRVVRCVVPLDYDWDDYGRGHRVDVSTWIKGYQS